MDKMGENNKKTTGVHPISQFVESLDSRHYGGSYINDDYTMSIATVSGVEIQNKFAQHPATAGARFFYVPVTYTQEQLLLARDKVVKANLDGVETVGINAKENAIVVFGETFTSKQKRDIEDCSPVKNVVFFDREAYITLEANRETIQPPPIEIAKKKEIIISTDVATYDVYGGDSFYDLKTGDRSSIGHLFIDMQGQYCLMSCGHGKEARDEISLDNSALFGIVAGSIPGSEEDNPANTAGWIDAAIVKATEANFNWHGLRGIGNLTTVYWAQLGPMFYSGSSSGVVGNPKRVEINATKCIKTIYSSNGQQYYHYRFFKFGYAPIPGDSGSCVAQFIDTGDYVYACAVGVVDARRKSSADLPDYDCGLGCEMGYVIDHMQLNIYNDKN